jgi:DNA polymerase alpha subunit B
MSPDSLRWKLEAFCFSNKTVPHSALKNVTLDSVLSLKAQLQREVSREKKAQPRTSTVSANVNRMRKPAGMPTVMNRNINLPGPAVSSGRTVVAQVKQEEVQVAGPSRVVFSGPKQDDEGKTRRACK